MDDGKPGPKNASMQDLLTVIVPAFNEEASIVTTIEMLQDVIPDLCIRAEILMIDDGSKDRTRTLIEDLCQRYPNCRMTVNPRNIGLGTSVVNAINELPEPSWATIMPADNEFFFSSIQNHLSVRNECDVILGYCQNLMVRSLSRRIASALYAHVVNLVYGYSYRYHNGMKLFRISALKGIQVQARGYAYFAELLAKALLRKPTLRVGEVPFIARGRAKGVSKAFRPTAVLRAILEVYRGHRSVNVYRLEVIKEHARRSRIE